MTQPKRTAGKPAEPEDAARHSSGKDKPRAQRGSAAKASAVKPAAYARGTIPTEAPTWGVNSKVSFLDMVRSKGGEPTPPAAAAKPEPVVEARTRSEEHKVFVATKTPEKPKAQAEVVEVARVKEPVHEEEPVEMKPVEEVESVSSYHSSVPEVVAPPPKKEATASYYVLEIERVDKLKFPPWFTDSDSRNQAFTFSATPGAPQPQSAPHVYQPIDIPRSGMHGFNNIGTWDQRYPFTGVPFNPNPGPAVQHRPSYPMRPPRGISDPRGPRHNNNVIWEHALGY